MKIKERLKKSGGFTLIEMLIVVAIIAILVAVSIPMVSSNLDEAKVATDQANERAVKAAAMITYMTDDTLTTTTTFKYDAADGKLVKNTDTVKGYGQCKKHKGAYLEVTISKETDTEGEVTLTWAGVTGGSFDSTSHADE